jgi:hypothetical protein
MVPLVLTAVELLAIQMVQAQVDELVVALRRLLKV